MVRPLTFILAMPESKFGWIKAIIIMRFPGIRLFFQAKAGTDLQLDYM
jgi:hypothetical protein